MNTEKATVYAFRVTAATDAGLVGKGGKIFLTPNGGESLQLQATMPNGQKLDFNAVESCKMVANTHNGFKKFMNLLGVPLLASAGGFVVPPLLIAHWVKDVTVLSTTGALLIWGGMTLPPYGAGVLAAHHILRQKSRCLIKLHDGDHIVIEGYVGILSFISGAAALANGSLQVGENDEAVGETGNAAPTPTPA